MTEKQTEALEKLNRGIQESRQEVQQRTMNLAQDYFDDSAEVLKQQIQENRATLEGLPDQIPGGREEAFQMLFQELMDNYSNMEKYINEAQENVANLDTDQIRRQGEVEATDAARRKAKELGIDLTEVEGTGSEGNITVKDVEKLGDERLGEPKATDAAKRDAEEYGIDLSEIEGTGADGSITVGDVTEYMEKTKERAPEETEQGAQDAAGQAAGQAQDAAGQVTDQASGALTGITDQVGQAAAQVQDTAGGTLLEAPDTAGQGQDAGGDGVEEPTYVKVTNAARRKAEEMGVDLSEIEGTGSGGLITMKDVMGS